MEITHEANKALEQEILQVSAGGERVTHLWPDGCYLAHLSIYRFALQFIQGAVVLDMGSGAGYGSAYLAESGAAFVEGVDVSDEAVAFSQHHFVLDNLHYQVMDLQHAVGFKDKVFDIVFSSNTFEHVPNVLASLREAWRLMKPGGCFILAVPPITDESLKKMNVSNPYHLHIWSPRQWYHILGLFFNEVQPYTHVFAKSESLPDFAAPEETDFSEKDFVFEPLSSVEEMYHIPTMTAIFVARDSRSEMEVPLADDDVTFVDDSFSRSLLSALQEQYILLREENQRLHAHIAKINQGSVMRLLNRMSSVLKHFKIIK